MSNYIWGCRTRRRQRTLWCCPSWSRDHAAWSRCRRHCRRARDAESTSSSRPTRRSRGRRSRTVDSDRRRLAERRGWSRSVARSRGPGYTAGATCRWSQRPLADSEWRNRRRWCGRSAAARAGGGRAMTAARGHDRRPVHRRRRRRWREGGSWLHSDGRSFADDCDGRPCSGSVA